MLLAFPSGAIHESRPQEPHFQGLLALPRHSSARPPHFGDIDPCYRPIVELVRSQVKQETLDVFEAALNQPIVGLVARPIIVMSDVQCDLEHSRANVGAIGKGRAVLLEAVEREKFHAPEKSVVKVIESFQNLLRITDVGNFVRLGLLTGNRFEFLWHFPESIR